MSEFNNKELKHLYDINSSNIVSISTAYNNAYKQAVDSIILAIKNYAEYTKYSNLQEVWFSNRIKENFQKSGVFDIQFINEVIKEEFLHIPCNISYAGKFGYIIRVVLDPNNIILFISTIY